MFLESLGVNVHSLSIQDTPTRVVKMMRDLLTPVPFEPTVFENDGEYDSLVVVCDIPFASLCEHHVLPFLGVAHVGYLPNGRVIGLSKLARFVEKHARALQVQERMTTQIADSVAVAMGTETVGVIIEAEHMCMTIRGVQKPGSFTRTSVMRGELRNNGSLKQEFIDAVPARSRG